MHTVLICDDEKDIRGALRIYLTEAGYAVQEAENGQEALEILGREEVHLVLLDIMMPVMDGLTALSQLRQRCAVPVILLTAKGEDIDKIAGLNLGADDYITKPFNSMEVLARIRAVLRRYDRQTEDVRPTVLTIGGIELDDEAKTVNLPFVSDSAAVDRLVYRCAETMEEGEYQAEILPELEEDCAHTGYTVVTEAGAEHRFCDCCGKDLDPQESPEPVETSDLHIFSSISVGTDMVVTYTVRKTDLTNYTKFWVEVVKHNPEGDATFTYEQADLTENDSTYTFQFKNIYAKEMGIVLDARLYAETADGAVYRSEPRSGNIRDYLGGRLTLTTNKPEQRVLAADMLNYGAAAQMFTEFLTDHLVNQELTEDQLAKLHEYETTELPDVSKTNSNYRPEGTSNILFNSVTLGNEVLLNLTVRLTEDTENVQVLVREHKDDGTVGATVATLDAAWGGSTFQAVFNGIGADKMRTEYDFVTLVNGVETGNVRTWSVEAYVGEIRAGTLPLKTAMANALLTYGDSAAAYLAAHQRGVQDFVPQTIADPAATLPPIPEKELTAYLSQNFALHVMHDDPPHDPLLTLLLTLKNRRIGRKTDHIEVISYDDETTKEE